MLLLCLAIDDNLYYVLDFVTNYAPVYAEKGSVKAGDVELKTDDETSTNINIEGGEIKVTAEENKDEAEEEEKAEPEEVAETEEASEEACILEHTISNETINKLDSFLDKTTPEFVSHKELTAKNPIVPLLECTEGSLLHVAMIEAFSKHNRLIDLGVVPGELITLKRRLHNDAVVIKVKGCDIALSPEIASSIMVERCNTK